MLLESDTRIMVAILAKKIGTNRDRFSIRDLLLAMQILNGQYIPSQEEQGRWDVAPLVNDVPEPNQQNNLGDYLILQRKVLGIINF